MSVANSAIPAQPLNTSLINTTGNGNVNGANIVFNAALNGTSLDGSNNGLNNVTLNAGGSAPNLGGNINFYGGSGYQQGLGRLGHRQCR